MEVALLEIIQHKYDLGRWMRALAVSCCRKESDVWWKTHRLSCRARRGCGFFCPL